MKFSPLRVFPAVLKTVPSVNRRQTGSPFHKLVLQVQGGGKPSEQRAAKLLNEAPDSFYFPIPTTFSALDWLGGWINTSPRYMLLWKAFLTAWLHFPSDGFEYGGGTFIMQKEWEGPTTASSQPTLFPLQTWLFLGGKLLAIATSFQGFFWTTPRRHTTSLFSPKRTAAGFWFA